MEVNGEKLPWYLDLGAGLTTLAKSTADRLNVRLLRGGIPAATATSRRVTGDIGMVDRLTIGKATVENVPVYILPDADLTFGSEMVRAILGLSVLVALHKVAWLDGGKHLAIGASAPTPRNAHHFSWHENGIQLPIVFPQGFGGANFDSGAGSTTLYTPALASLAPEVAARAIDRTVQISGAGGIETQHLKTVPGFSFQLCGVPIRIGTANIERRADLGLARLGNDMVSQLGPLALDFTHMNFDAGPSSDGATKAPDRCRE